MATNTVTFSWTRAEFSVGSTTELFENTINDFSTSTRVWAGPSKIVSAQITKTVNSTNYWYWVRHVLQGGTTGTQVLVTSPPVQYIA